MLTFETAYLQLQVGDEIKFTDRADSCWYLLTAKSRSTFSVISQDEYHYAHNGLFIKEYKDRPVVIKCNSPSDILFSYIAGGTISPKQLEIIKDHINAEISKS